MDSDEKEKIAELQKEVDAVKKGQTEREKTMEARLAVVARLAKHAVGNMDEDQQAKYKADLEKDDDIKAASDDDEMKKAIYDNIKNNENYKGSESDPKIASLEAEIEELKKSPKVAKIIEIKGLTAKKEIDAETTKLMAASVQELDARMEELQFVAKITMSQSSAPNSRLGLSQMSAAMDEGDTEQYSAKSDSDLLSVIGWNESN